MKQVQATLRAKRDRKAEESPKSVTTVYLTPEQRGALYEIVDRYRAFGVKVVMSDIMRQGLDVAIEMHRRKLGKLAAILEENE